MKRLIAFLSVLLCAPAYADGFGVNDKVLYFNSNVLIDVIKNTFPQNLQLDVANKYVELMDKSGNVSIADLITVCGVGNLDREKCRNFINDLLTTMDIGDTVKPFYWADYIPYRGDEPSNTFVPHMGFEQDTGIWTIRFPWMKEQSFQKQYPGVEHLGGISACTAESGTVHVADTSKKFAQNEQTGSNCWCKMTFPEESAWVYHTSMDSVTISTGKTTDSDTMCNRGCALECLSAVRGADESMRAAMFTAVKLNGANEPGPIDPEEFKKKFKKCEFDWANDIDSYEANVKGYRLKPIDTEIGIWFYETDDMENLGYDEWGVEFAFMRREKFQCKYPGVTQIRGTAKFESFDPRPHDNGGIDIGWCYCKITYPEKSKWIKLGIPLHDTGDFLESINKNSDTYYFTATQMCVKYCDWYGGMYWPDMLKSIGKK